MSFEVDVLRRLAQLEQRSGQIYDQVFSTYIPLQTPLTEVGGGLAGAALNVGAYTVGPVGGGATYSFNYPTTAKALNLRMTVTWAAANVLNQAFTYPTGLTAYSPMVRALVAGISSDAVGICALDATAKFQITVANANSTYFYLVVLGYFL